MTRCDSGNLKNQCGRITERSGENDYLPMELKSVRDYGLGSILSYIEGRKVVFKTGLSVMESYNKDAVESYFKDLNGMLGGIYGYL